MWPFRKREPELDPDMELMARKTVEAVKEYRREKNISEPVRAIAQAMRERPGSFRVEWLTKPTNTISFGPKLSERYRITDRRTGLSATAIETFYGHRDGHRIRLPFSLTADETDFLWSEGEKWLKARQQRTKDYINAKRRREWSRKYGVEAEQRGRVGG